jgi:hypothetical protein
LRALFYIVIPPPPLGHLPNIPIDLRMLMNSSENERGKGMLPACCLPLRGREGFTLIAAVENYSNDFEKEGFNRAVQILFIQQGNGSFLVFRLLRLGNRAGPACPEHPDDNGSYGKK